MRTSLTLLSLLALCLVGCNKDDMGGAMTIDPAPGFHHFQTDTNEWVPIIDGGAMGFNVRKEWEVDLKQLFTNSFPMIELGTNGHIFIHDDPTNVTILGKHK